MSQPTLIVILHDAEQCDPAAARLVTAARIFGQPVHALVMGPAAVAQQAALLDGVDKVFHHPVAGLNAETLARAIAALQSDHGAVLATHCMLARAALPRAAALSDAAYLADVVALDGQGRYTRPMYAGSVVAQVRSTGRTFLTVRASAFEPACARATPAVIEALPPIAADARTVLQGREQALTDRPDLTRARVVVAAGRGIGSADSMRLVEALADRLGGAVAASRAAVDAGFAPNALQVGQTGKTVAPDIYIAAGISGAIQHVAGIKDAKLIIAINKDPDAAIFSMADIGLVGDLFDVLPRLTQGLPAV